MGGDWHRRLAGARGLAAATVAVAVLAAGCSGGSPRRRGASPTSTGPAAPATTTTLVAEAPPSAPTGASMVATAKADPIRVYDSPSETSPSHDVSRPPVASQVPRVFLVRDQRPGWVQVLLQARPNGSTGWVRQTDVSLTGTDYRVTVELGAARVTLRRGDEVVFTAPAAVGTLAEPTPKGLCYVVALVPLPGGARGPFFFRLSAFSDAPNQQGDVGQIALAGTEDAASLGHANTRGAVLVSMDVLRRLGDLIPLGTPVEIVA